MNCEKFDEIIHSLMRNYHDAYRRDGVLEFLTKALSKHDQCIRCRNGEMIPAIFIRHKFRFLWLGIRKHLIRCYHNRKANKNPPTSQGYPPNVKTEAMRLIFEEDYTLEQAAAQIGCSLCSIRNWKRQKSKTSPASQRGTKPSKPRRLPTDKKAMTEIDATAKTAPHKQHVKTPYKRKSKFSNDDVLRMAAMYEKGNSCTTIAKEFGASDTYVLRLLRDQGVKLRPRWATGLGHYTASDHRRMADLYRSGKSQSEIAKEFDCCQTYVSDVLRKLGVPIRPASKLTMKDHKRMAEMYKSGQTHREIAQKFGCSQYVVGDVLFRQEVSMRPSGVQSRYSEQDHERMEEMYRNGQTQVAIAKEFGCTPGMVRYIFSKRGVVKSYVVVPKATVQQPSADKTSRTGLDEFVRDFWRQGGRATEVLLLPPEIGPKVVQHVNDALRYAYDQLR